MVSERPRASEPSGVVRAATERWTIEQVIAVAPTPARFTAAEGAASPTQWLGLGADHRAVWGRYRGSGREPYDTMVDHEHVAWRCSCPSRSLPCKHALALLAMWVRGHVPAATAPPSVASWVDGHARRAAASHETGTTPAGAADAAAGGPAEPVGADDPARDRARDERIARLRHALVELDRWLDDRLRTGLADPALARFSTWDDLAARLVDARAGALANRVRRLAGVVGARPDWHEVVLAELGVLHLLAEAGQRLSDLPTPLADAVATACGWQVRQADVLAGVPETDTWLVAGRSDTREDRIEVRRTWLRGIDSRCWAMVLSFAAYRQSLDRSLPVGARLVADVHRYPGLSLRALVGTVHDGPEGEHHAPPATTIEQACDMIGAALATEPWTDRLAATVLAAPTVTAGRWVLADDTGSLTVVPTAPGIDTMIAATAGTPLPITIEWTVDGIVPLTVHLPDRALDVGPRADASFVSAA
jgi:hypothetical protein